MKAKTRIVCNDCKSIIYSKYFGHLATCKCGKVGIDETAYYCRILGSNYSEVKVEEATRMESNSGTNKEQ